VGLLATVSDDRGLVGLFMQGEHGTELLYSGEKLVNARDIDTSLEEDALLAADPSVVSAGPDDTQLSGAILKFSLTGGEPQLLAAGYAPVSVTVHESGTYFSGRDPSSGEPGVFRLVGESVESLFIGAPLVDPSGIAVLKDGSVLVADTRLFESTPINSEAGVVRIKDGEAKLFASGFATGYPAGIAVTTDEATLIVSGEAPDRSDAVYLFSVEDPSAGATVVRAEFSVEQNSAGGLKARRGENTFVWASCWFNSGTVYKIKA
jgi:sugar lactone lactonase YvrE